MKSKMIGLFLALLLRTAIHANECEVAWKGPDFLIIGAMKSGTTSLYEYLVQHPQITGAHHKEIDFFDLHYHMGIDWYRSQFSTTAQSKNKLIGEASPSYFYLPDVPQKVRTHFPQTKLIVILRDPVQRAFSHYRFVLMQGEKYQWKQQENLSFEEALEAESERVQPELAKASKGKKYNVTRARRFGYLARSRYIEQIENWEKHFPQEQMLIIFFEELVAHPKETVNKVFKFLGVSEHTLHDYSIFNENSSVKMVMNEKTKKMLYWYFEPYNKKLEVHLGILHPWNRK